MCDLGVQLFDQVPLIEDFLRKPLGRAELFAWIDPEGFVDAVGDIGWAHGAIGNVGAVLVGRADALAAPHAGAKEISRRARED